VYNRRAVETTRWRCALEGHQVVVGRVEADSAGAASAPEAGTAEHVAQNGWTWTEPIRGWNFGGALMVHQREDKRGRRRRRQQRPMMIGHHKRWRRRYEGLHFAALDSW